MNKNRNPLFLAIGTLLIGISTLPLLLEECKGACVSMGLFMFFRYFINIEFLEKLNKTHPNIYFAVWSIMILFFAVYLPLWIDNGVMAGH